MLTGHAHSCERENQWLEEAAYYVDTSMVPRGGARRRKSMEPKALANLNGMLVPTPGRSNGRDCNTAPNTPIRRRDSVQWMRITPEKTSTGAMEVDDDGDNTEWDDMDGLLVPIPPTPAPEAIASYAANLGAPETPTTQLSDGSSSELFMRTCPPKQQQFYNSEYAELGAGVLAQEKDERVLMRLMAARRKSLQFAPKIASPLSKTWN